MSIWWFDWLTMSWIFSGLVGSIVYIYYAVMAYHLSSLHLYTYRHMCVLFFWLALWWLVFSFHIWKIDIYRYTERKTNIHITYLSIDMYNDVRTWYIVQQFNQTIFEMLCISFMLTGYWRGRRRHTQFIKVSVENKIETITKATYRNLIADVCRFVWFFKHIQWNGIYICNSQMWNEMKICLPNEKKNERINTNKQTSDHLPWDHNELNARLNVKFTILCEMRKSKSFLLFYIQAMVHPLYLRGKI